jgi:putative transposase
MRIGPLRAAFFTFISFHRSAATMPRPSRVVLPSVPLHIIQRGNNRIPCFLSPNDYLVYLDMLRECAMDCGCAVHAYVLMSNHVHLLLSPDDDNSVSMMMQRLGRRYVRYFNQRHGRTGTLWEGRFRSSLVQEERYLMICHRYIELNPVRARIVAAPADYPWSSHSANAFGRHNALLTPHLVYTALGSTSVARQVAYRHLFNEALTEDTLDQVRHAANGNRALGTASAKASAFKLAGEKLPKTGV